MPTIGDILPAKELGYLNNTYKYKYIECPDCHSTRWVALIRGCERRLRCGKCSISFSKKLNWGNRPIADINTPPYVGEIRHGEELNKTSFDQHHGKYIYVKCQDCGIERWITYVQYIIPDKARCNDCSHHHLRGKHNGQWKTGRTKNTEGYTLIKIQPDDFFYSMASINGYVAEHRLIMAKHLRRCLLKWEVVHHINGIRTDNRLENLELLPHRKYHIVDTLSKSAIATLEKRVAYLEVILIKNGIAFKRSRKYTTNTNIVHNKKPIVKQQLQPTLI